MTYYTHINRNTIDSNRKQKTNNPPIKIQKGKYGKPEYFDEVELPSGSKLIYTPHGHILPCGARLVIISKTKPIGSLTSSV